MQFQSRRKQKQTIHITSVSFLLQFGLFLGSFMLSHALLKASTPELFEESLFQACNFPPSNAGCWVEGVFLSPFAMRK